MPLVLSFVTPEFFLLGDFNMVSCPDMDRLRGGSRGTSALAQWASTFFLVDVWHHLHPATREFTCQSGSFKSLSRIDLAYASAAGLCWVADASILPRGISDHALLA